MLKSIAAILTGFLLIGALALAADAVLVRLAPGVFDLGGRVDNIPVLLFMHLYVAVFAVGGSYVTARLAPCRPLRHALALGGLGLLFTAINTIASWSQLPVWSHLLALVVVMPCAWLGGRIRETELTRPATPVFAL